MDGAGAVWEGRGESGGGKRGRESGHGDGVVDTVSVLYALCRGESDAVFGYLVIDE